jgi:hypothetical protein
MSFFEEPNIQFEVESVYGARFPTGGGRTRGRAIGIRHVAMLEARSQV